VIPLPPLVGLGILALSGETGNRYDYREGTENDSITIDDERWLLIMTI
jgi:hypothetical protein